MSAADENENPQNWLTINEACNYLQISEQTMFRWMREGKISYYKIGKSTRFKADDLDLTVERVVGRPEGEILSQRCPVCGHTRLVDGSIASAGKIYFKPAKTKFWVWSASDVPMQAKCCTSCGNVQLKANLEKLQRLTGSTEEPDAE